MIFFHRALTVFEKYAKAVNINSLLLSVGSKRLYTDLQIIKKPTTQSFFPKQKTKNDDIDYAALFMLIMPVSAFGLGVWQIKRKIEKNEIIRNLKEKTKIPPVDLPKDLNLLKKMEFQAVRVKGKFDHSKELYLGPRPKHSEKFSDLSSFISTPKGGYMVITPFTLSDRDLTILVNRGWVPGNKKSPESRKEGQITEEVELVGLVKLSEKRPPLAIKNHPEKNFWIYRDLEEMSKITKASPVLIEADKSSSVPGGPMGGQTNITVKDDHVIYMTIWFGMSLVTGWMWYNRYMRKSPRAHWLIF